MNLFKDDIGGTIRKAVGTDDLDDIGMLWDREQGFVFLAQPLVHRDAVGEYQLEYAHHLAKRVEDLICSGKASLPQALLYHKTITQDIFFGQILFILRLGGRGNDFIRNLIARLCSDSLC